MRHRWMIPLSLSLLLLGHGVADAQGFVRVDSRSDSQAVAAPHGGRSAKTLAERRRRTVDFIRGESIALQAATWVGRVRVVGATLSMSSDEQTAYILVRRTTSSGPEVHARWDDLVIVRSGEGAIELGDSLRGSTYRAPGERVGGDFVGQYRIVVHAGDMVRVPAAVPHAFVVSGSQPLEYLVIKQRRQELPIRWFGER